MVTASDTKKSLRCQRPISSETRRHAAEGSARTSWRQPQAHLATKGFDQKHAEARERTDIMVAASATSWSTKLLGVARPAQQTATSTGPLLFSTFVSTARTAVKSLTSALTVSTLPVPSSPCTANHLLCCCNHDAETLLCACNDAAERLLCYPLLRFLAAHVLPARRCRRRHCRHVAAVRLLCSIQWALYRHGSCVPASVTPDAWRSHVNLCTCVPLCLLSKPAPRILSRET